MILKSAVLLLSAASALAQQSCLSSSDPAACCSNGEVQGEETVGDTLFQYICGSIPSPPRFKGHNAANAHECAELCSLDDTCFATSWRMSGSNPRGNCFFAIGEDFESKENKAFMLLAKAPEPVPDPPCLASPEANACCTGGRTEGEETVGGVVFRYTCGAVPTPSKFKGHSVGSAHECAELCAQDENCFATSWRISGSSPRGNCFFALSETFDSEANKDQMLIYKVVESTTDPKCDEEKKECLEKNKQCNADKDKCTESEGQCKAEKDKCIEDKGQCEDEREVYEAVNLQCEGDKSRAENAERECLREVKEISEKKRQCREEQQQCHEEKAQQALKCHEEKAEQALQYHHCQTQNNQLSLDIIKQKDEISDLQSTIKTLQSTLDDLKATHAALQAECKGPSCRSGIVNAGKSQNIPQRNHEITK